MRALLQLTIKDMSVVYNKSTGENYRQVKNYLSFFYWMFYTCSMINSYKIDSVSSKKKTDANDNKFCIF